MSFDKTLLHNFPYRAKILRPLTAAFALLLLVAVSRPAIADPAIAPSQAYSQRNTPEAIARVARKLAAMLNPNVRGMAPFNQAIHAKRYAAALHAFKQFFMKKMLYANFKPGWSLSAWLPGPSNASAARRAAIFARANALLHGQMIIKGKTVDIGEPGAVNWLKFSKGGMINGNVFPWHVAAFDPLVSAYTFTGNPKYLRTWCDYVDDWTLNQKAGMAALKPELVGDIFTGGPYSLMALAQTLHDIAATPGSSAALPAATLARVVMRVFWNDLPPAVVYFRSCPQNWDLAAAPPFVEDAGYFDMFQVSHLCLRLGRRLMETNITTQTFPDGTDNQRDNGYNYAYPIAAAQFMAALNRQNIHPEWMTPEWLQQWNYNLQQRCRFLWHCLTQNGEDPAGLRADKRDRAPECLSVTMSAAPSTLYETAIQRLIYVYFHAMQAKTCSTSLWLTHNYVISHEPEPAYRSEWFPYAGYYLLRNGWKQDDALLFMLSTNNPGKDFRTVTDNNIVTLRDFGQDLIATTQTGAYGYNNSPLWVDGKGEFFHAGIPQWGHRGYMISVRRDKPSRCFWLSSRHFTVAQGVYKGPFGDLPHGPDTSAGILSDEILWNKALVQASQNAIRGVRYARWIEAPGGSGLYIITDRISSSVPHKYSELWPLPIGSSKFTVFRNRDIVADQAAQSIKTRTPGVANLSMYNFGQPVKYTKQLDRIRTKWIYSHRLYNLCIIHANWKNQGGHSLLITVIDPRKNMAHRIASIRALSPGHDVQGFTAHLKNKMTIEYLAATNRARPLTLGAITADAKSLLLETAPGGTIRGVVLGCLHLTANGASEQLPRPDFEFALRSGSFTIRHLVYRPILPVKILPGNTNGFVGSQQIALTCPTPDVQIRYTLDGISPDAHSPLYTRPFTIDRSTVIKARAFRYGVTAMPFTQDGTEVTDVSRAVFTRLHMEPAQHVRQQPASGLLYDYYKGSWRSVLLFHHLLKPQGSGVVPKLFDLKFRKGAPGPCAFRYAGYFDAPADGAYTFYAPHELVATTLMAGYSLRVTVDGNRWYPATSRHAYGTWTIGLKKGLHSFQVFWGNYRTPGLAAKLNNPGLKAPLIWNGVTPNLEISGPNLVKQPIRSAWLRR